MILTITFLISRIQVVLITSYLNNLFDLKISKTAYIQNIYHGLRPMALYLLQGTDYGRPEKK